MAIRSVKGMNDILPEEVGRWHLLESEFRSLAELYGFREIRTPILENTELFVRSIGDATEVVEKQMFTLERDRESFSMRPEGTAGAARAYVQHGVNAREPVSRWYYLGPMFRAERPQRGRYRQFYQAGLEVYGDAGPAGDAELIDLVVTLYKRLGISDVEVLLNSIGGPETRARYRQVLLEYLEPRSSELSEHARVRLNDNPLRILDSKDPRDKATVAGVPSVLDHLTPEDREHWDGLRRALDALGVEYKVTPGLVRGLDYYTRTLFEVTSNAGELGAQNTLGAGGRYDNMIAELGGPKVPAIGFAFGLDRILLAMGERELARAGTCFVAPMGEPALLRGLALGRELRAGGIRTEVDSRGGSLKSMLRRADSMAARICFVLGESELERGVVQMKDLAAHTQTEVPLDQAVTRAAEVLASKPEGSTT
jgi:histidyl-tRNA synthetase